MENRTDILQRAFKDRIKKIKFRKEVLIMTTKALLTMEEIQAGLTEAHSKEERFNFLMSLMDYCQ